ncbi:hypothetical protein FRC07_003338 [Ceratobasidium sp. 392]|nr:hypothetical protein FRC07_003338 [Ceratobasidium sp. 392]
MPPARRTATVCLSPATCHRTSSVCVSDTYPPRPEYYWMVAQSVLIATYGWSETGTPDGLSISLDDYPRAFTNLVTGTSMKFEELDKAFSEMQAIYQGRFGTMIEDERMLKIVHAIMWNLQEAKLDRRLPEQLVILLRSRSLTDIHASSALAPSPLRNCAAFDEAGAPLPPSWLVSDQLQVYEFSEAVPRPSMQTSQFYHYPTTTPYPIQTPATACQGYLQTPPTVTTAPEGGIEDDVEDAYVRTEMGSPNMGIDAPGTELQFPPIRTLPPLPSYGSGPKAMLVAEQTRLAMCGGGTGISRNVLLYGPAGVTPAPAKLACNNARNKLPPILSHVPPRQATFLGVQSVPVAGAWGRFATTCAPPRAGVPVPVLSRPVYPPAGIVPLVAGHQGLPRGGRTTPIENGDELAECKE